MDASGHLRNLRNFSLLAGIFNVGTGALVLLAWWQDWDAVKTIAPNFPAMTPNSALAVVALGCAILAPTVSASRRTVLAVTLLAATALVAVGALSLWERLVPASYLPANHLLDELLNPEFATGSGRIRFPGVSAGLEFLLLGLAVLLRGKRPGWAQLLLIPALTIALAATFQQTFRFFALPLQQRIIHTVGMAPHTALCIFLGIFGIAAVSPRTSFVSRLLSPTPAGDILRIFSVSAVSVPALLILASVAVQQISPEHSGFVHSALVSLIVAEFLLATGFAVRALEGSEGRFFQLMEEAGDGIFLANLEGNLTDLNKAGCDMLACETRQELIGRNLLSFLPRNAARRLSAVKGALLKPGAVHRGEWRIRREDGKFIPVDICSRILAGGIWQITVRDISSRKKIEERLRFLSNSSRVLAKSLDYRDTVQKIAELVVPRIADYCVVTTRDEASRQLKFTCLHADRSRQRDLEEISAGYPSAFTRRIGAAAGAEDQLIRFETVTDQTYLQFPVSDAFRERQKSLRTHSYVAAPLVARDRVLGSISLGITDDRRKFLREDEDFIRQIAHRFAQAIDNARLYQEALAATRAREDILAIVSHDLKNPLATANLTVQLALMKLEASEGREGLQQCLARIGSALQRMKRLVDLLLSFGKLQAGTFRAVHRPLQLSRLFREVETIFLPLAAKYSVDLQFLLDNEIEMSGDYDALFQALSNLVSNAVKFSPPEGRVAVCGSADGSTVTISVADQGPGIPPELQGHLFTRYWQASRVAGLGSGLGLFITRGVVTAHGGEVSVASSPGKGSTFTIHLPRWCQAPFGCAAAS